MRMQNRVAVSLIVGDGQDKDKWNKLLLSITGVVDHIYVSYNGKQKAFPYPQSTRMTVQFDEWTDDFSEARNKAFAMIPKNEFEWIIWLDADDTLEKPELLKPLMEKATREGIHQVFLPYIYASDDVDGTPRVTQWRERLLSTRVPWRWYFAIHEVCHTQPGSKVANWNDYAFVKHHRDVDPFTHKNTRERNRRILSKAMELAPDEPRFTYYQANETFAEAYHLFGENDPKCAEFFREAITLYQKFGRQNPSSDDAYIANYRIGDSLRLLGEFPKAIDIAMQGIKIRPRWADCWMLACHSMYGMQEWKAAEEFATIALAICEPPLTNQISEPLTYDYTPYALRALARTEMRDFKGAAEDYEAGLAFWANPILQERYDEMKKRRDGVEAQQAENIRQKTFGKRSERSVAFLVRPLPEVWNPSKLAAGSGGTEWCVHEIARRFKTDGFRTAIFGTPGDERGGDAEGIEWWNSDEFDPNEKFTHIVSVRAPEVFDSPLQSKTKTLWLHDVNMGGKEIENSPWGNRFDKPDHIVALTDWHAHHLPRIYNIDPKKITVIGNGINLKDYPEWGEREKGKFIFASSPDRGTDTLLNMWPEIKSRIPEASLHIYYGWNMLDKIVALSGGNHPLAQMKAAIVAQYEAVKHLDVEWYNRIPRDELQKVETTCDLWLYPTHQLETYCITALEMQMNGVIPIVNPVGALQETINPKHAMGVLGKPNHPTYTSKFVDQIEFAYNLSNSQARTIRNDNRNFASELTWDHRYDQWRDMLGFARKTGKPRTKSIMRGK